MQTVESGGITRAFSLSSVLVRQLLEAKLRGTPTLHYELANGDSAVYVYTIVIASRAVISSGNAVRLYPPDWHECGTYN